MLKLFNSFLFSFFSYRLLPGTVFLICSEKSISPAVTRQRFSQNPTLTKKRKA
jgi:hypothetical protein